MIPRLQVEILLDTAAHAATVRDSLSAQAASRPRHGGRFEAAPAVEADEAGRGHVVRLDVRYPARGDRDAVRDWVRQQLDEHPVVKGWIRGIVVSTHLCTHDEERPGPCSESEHVVVLSRGERVNGGSDPARAETRRTNS